MDRATAEKTLSDVDLVPCIEGALAQTRDLERALLEADIPVAMTAKPKGACCSGGCSCGGKFQLLVREDDVPKVQQFLAREWLDAVEREGLGGTQKLVSLKVGDALPEGAADAPLACPACGCAAPLVEGACSDCGLVLE